MSGVGCGTRGSGEALTPDGVHRENRQKNIPDQGGRSTRPQVGEIAVCAGSQQGAL